MRARTGCLGLLALWALLGVYAERTGGFGEEGGGRFALLGLLGLAVVILFGAFEGPKGGGREPRAPAWPNDETVARNPTLLHYETPAARPSAESPHPGSMPSFLTGIGVAALFLAAILHFGAASGFMAVVEGALVVLGISLIAFASILGRRGRR